MELNAHGTEVVKESRTVSYYCPTTVRVCITVLSHVLATVGKAGGSGGKGQDGDGSGLEELHCSRCVCAGVRM